MDKKIGQKELKDILSSCAEKESGKKVDKVSFDTRMKGDTNELGFYGSIIRYQDGEVISWDASDTAVIVLKHVRDELGYSVLDVQDNMGTRIVNGKTVPVFKGFTADVIENNQDMDTRKIEEKGSERMPVPKAKSLSFLTDTRREEQIASLEKLDDRSLLETIQGHFESHPTLPGEKVLKDMTDKLLDSVDFEVMDPEHDELNLEPEQREDIIRRYADTRIRETKIKGIGNDFDPADLKTERIDQYEDSVVSVHKAFVEIQKLNDEDFYVLAAKDSGGYITIGKLPDNFVTNNPMNVESCQAELQIVDYSNGKMKNTSIRAVIDTDVMSGDVVVLEDDMLAGLDLTTGLGK